jgi:hypothetical protein
MRNEILYSAREKVVCDKKKGGRVVFKLDVDIYNMLDVVLRPSFQLFS